MRKFIGLASLVIIGSFTLNSCDPWEDETYHGPENEIEVSGTWKLTALQLTEAVDFNGDGTASTDLMAETNCYQNELIVFNADFTGKGISNSYAEIEIVDPTYTVNCVQEVEESPMTWEQPNASLVKITAEGVVVEAALSGDQLQYTIANVPLASSADGQTQITQNLIYTYTKQ